MLREDGFETLAGAEGFYFGLHAAPAEMCGNLRERHLFQMQQREQRSVVRREMGENKLRLTEIALRRRVRQIFERIMFVIALRESSKGRALMLAAEFEAHVRRDALEPVHERLVWPPAAERTPGTHEGFLHHVFEIGALPREAMQHRCDDKLIAAHEFIKGIKITCLSPPDEDEIVIRRRFDGGRGRHGRMVLGTKAGTWQRGSLSAASLPLAECVLATDLVHRGIH